MKKIMVLAGCLLLFLAGPAQRTINDPNAEVRAARDFHAISISNAFDVYLTQGNEEAVAVSAAEIKFRDMITVEVKNGILSIGLKKDGWKLMRGNKKLKAYISFRHIDRLSVSGASDIYVQGGFRADDLKVDLSGASNLRGRIDAKKMIIDLSGASDMVLSGSAEQLNVDASGASKFKGIELVTNFCNARASGASDISVTVNKELSAHASGASDVKYRGEGVIRDIKTSGASKISKI